MPVYQFKCKNDGAFEVIHGMMEPHPTECPECGGEIVRVYSSPKIHYRGGGFYSTDKVLYEPTEDEVIESKLDRILQGKSPD